MIRVSMNTKERNNKVIIIILLALDSAFTTVCRLFAQLEYEGPKVFGVLFRTWLPTQHLSNRQEQPIALSLKTSCSTMLSILYYTSLDSRYSYQALPANSILPPYSCRPSQPRLYNYQKLSGTNSY